jgi:hypothetical protein
MAESGERVEKSEERTVVWPMQGIVSLGINDSDFAKSWWYFLRVMCHSSVNQLVSSTYRQAERKEAEFVAELFSLIGEISNPRVGCRRSIL